MKRFHTKVVGVSRRNDDGSSRQKVIRHCTVGEELMFRLDPHNEYDPNAVMVCRKNGQHLGFLGRDLAEETTPAMRAGVRYRPYIADLTGGTLDKPTRGVNLLVVVAEQGASEKVIRRYAEDMLEADEDYEPDGRLGMDAGLVDYARKSKSGDRGVFSRFAVLIACCLFAGLLIIGTIVLAELGVL